MNDTLLEVDQLHCGYGDVTVLRDVSLSLRRGEIGCLLGPSGSGKTTLLRCICGFESVRSGTIRIGGRTVQDQGTSVPPWKREVGVVFQEHALFPHLNVLENVMFGLGSRIGIKERTRAREVLAAVELPDCASRYPHELSGGQQQRIALARAIAPNPPLILLDEPFSSLDTNLRQRMKTELRELLKKLSVTALMITHAVDEAFDVADVMGVMGEQHILQWGLREHLYRRPRHHAVAAALGLCNLMTASPATGGRIVTPWGKLPCTGNESGGTWITRPDDFVLTADGPVRGRVMETRYRGDHTHVRLRLSAIGGQDVWVQTTTAPDHVPVGAETGIRYVREETWMV